MTTLDTTVGGYIVYDDTAIHGVGATRDEAWEDMVTTMSFAGIELLDDEDDSYAQPGSWARMSSFRVVPATTALLALVRAAGGNCAWGWTATNRSAHASDPGRIACTVEEEG